MKRHLLDHKRSARETSWGLLLGGVVFSQSQWSSTSSRCWIQKEPALYVTVHGYFLITFLFGAVVLALVAWKIFTLPSVTANKQQGQNWKAVITVLGLSSLVGMTWGLAILTPLGLSTIYIFAFFNSLQGEALGSGGPWAACLHQGLGSEEEGFATNRIPQRVVPIGGTDFPRSPLGPGASVSDSQKLVPESGKTTQTKTYCSLLFCFEAACCSHWVSVETPSFSCSCPLLPWPHVAVQHGCLFMICKSADHFWSNQM